MESYEFTLKIQKKDIDFLNKITEAYEGVGIVRTIDPEEARVKIVTLSYFKEEVEKIIESLRVVGIEIEILKSTLWEGVL